MTDPSSLFLTTLAPQGKAPPVVPGMPADGGQAMQQAPGGQPGPGTGGAGGGQPSGGMGSGIFMIAIVMFIVLMVMTSMSGRKQRKERDRLISALKRNDRVQTVGGIIGTVIELTDSEMVLRVDETSNTRIRFARSAVQQVLREGKEPARVEARAEPAA